MTWSTNLTHNDPFECWIKVSDPIRSAGSGFGSVVCVHGKHPIQPVNIESSFILKKKIEREFPRYDSKHSSFFLDKCS